jgi:hypothetical protein
MLHCETPDAEIPAVRRVRGQQNPAGSHDATSSAPRVHSCRRAGPLVNRRAARPARSFDPRPHSRHTGHAALLRLGLMTQRRRLPESIHDPSAMMAGTEVEGIARRNLRVRCDADEPGRLSTGVPPVPLDPLTPAPTPMSQPSRPAPSCTRAPRRRQRVVMRAPEPGSRGGRTVPGGGPRRGAGRARARRGRRRRRGAGAGGGPRPPQPGPAPARRLRGLDPVGARPHVAAEPARPLLHPGPEKKAARRHAGS